MQPLWQDRQSGAPSISTLALLVATVGFRAAHLRVLFTERSVSQCAIWCNDDYEHAGFERPGVSWQYNSLLTCPLRHGPLQATRISCTAGLPRLVFCY
jgi:hypothetical protein